MTSSPPPTLSTRELAAYSDAELNEYLDLNGGVISVHDDEVLMKDEDFIARLRLLARERSKAQPLPIDPNDLTARLQDVSAERISRPQAPSQAEIDGLMASIEQVSAERPARPMSPWYPVSETDWRIFSSREGTADWDEEESYRHDLKSEIEYYNILVSHGGWPSHPVSLGRDVLERPEYREILSYWRGGDNEEWMVFEHQQGEWRRFRMYQRANRKKGGNFLKYVDRVKRSLARHGFTSPFELDEDLERQDRLNTWIEFLDYEHWIYDKDIRVLKFLQPGYDKAWNELVASQVLRPHETKEFLGSFDSVLERSSDIQQAKKAVQSAEAAVQSAGETILKTSLKMTAQLRLSAAQSRLDAATRTLKSVMRRDGFIFEFIKKTKLSQHRSDGTIRRSYQSVKQAAERRSILLRWIVQQIPLIELEMNKAKVAENDFSDRVNSRSCDPAELAKKGHKRSHHEDTAHDEMPSKRPRFDDGQSSTLSPPKTPNAADWTPSSRDVKSNWSTVNSSQPRKSNSPDVPPDPTIPNGQRLRTVVAPSETIRTPSPMTAKLSESPKHPSTDNRMAGAEVEIQVTNTSEERTLQTDVIPRNIEEGRLSSSMIDHP